MKALVLHGIGYLQMEEVPIPELGPEDVLIRVVACGVCDGDLPRIFSQGVSKYPLVCGHEFAGLVADCGDQVTDLEKDARVAAYPLLWCGKCPACEQGKYAQCFDSQYLGVDCHGAFAEYVKMPRRNIIRIPDSVPLEVAAMIDPAAIALHALHRAGGVRAGETVAVFGTGPIGLMAAQWAEISGAGNVILFDEDPKKCALARELGFRYSFNSADRDIFEIIKDLTLGLGMDIAIDTEGTVTSMSGCINAVGIGGCAILLALPTAEIPATPATLTQVIHREISIIGSWNSVFRTSGNRDDWQAVLRSINAGHLLLEPLISHRVTLANACDTIHSMQNKSMTAMKVIIQPILG